MSPDKKIYDEGLIGILKQLRDDPDTAVAEAYGWPVGEGKDEILNRLVALNAERAAEEASGLVRWLRPEYQAPASATSNGKQTALEVEEEVAPPAVVVAPAVAEPWPKDLPAQAAALSAVLQSLTAPADVDTIAACFEGKKSKKRLEEIGRLLETLEALGRAKGNDEGGWLGV